MDFTIRKYNDLLESLQNHTYDFIPFNELMSFSAQRFIILRHDVDLLPHNSLVFARIQHQMGIRGVYYFRAVPESWDEGMILKIAELGHEVGYHYECLATTRGNLERGIKDFEKNLTALRKLVPVNTICMHGSPMSPYDSKDLWKKYDYRAYGIIAEPYFDVDFNKVFYLTDTGRRWDGEKVSVRDKVQSAYGLSFHRTDDIIKAAEQKKLPDQIMFTFHPQRWNDNMYLWTKELATQSVKNLVKQYFFIK